MRRKLGAREVSALGMGCWAIGGPFWEGDGPLGWGEVDDDVSVRAIHAGLDHGIDFLDTADVYGAGHSERVVARALQGRRDRVVVATKFGICFDESTKQVVGTRADPEYVRGACEASLKRLQTDYIDLLQFHLNDFDPAQAAPVRDALEELVAAGKIRAYGWSTDFVDRAEVFAQGSHCVAIQQEYNVLSENRPMVAFCEAHELASINRGPLAMGLLSGKYQSPAQWDAADIRSKTPEWMKYFKDGVPAPSLVAKLQAIREVLASNGRSLVQGALAFIWARSERNIPIPGFRTPAQIEETAAAMEQGPLTAAQVGEIDRLLAP